ncbi:DUF5655 domain-containing protein [Fimbriimonas ginsengisoli]|uniref:DUF5655 domain-containing protein n=1 Tax=Fimbriimonas ginsengisoli Gsoil 348 TaxID=661478 RepID=A0A068NU82_FIMGI|nr:DUF5655 domain-containing protein [Fimbriimonas ginsengisoli]AIE86927.1 hypothetical protein OP10G_3559 [Fimbriimonas ginsengisoli Gsoil 348]
MMIPSLFEGRPKASEIYGSLVPVLNALGAHSVEEKKSSLHVVAGRAAFLGVHPRKDGLRLNLVLARQLAGPRVAKAEQVSAKRYHNEVDIKDVGEIDEELRAWISEAYSRVTSG